MLLAGATTIIAPISGRVEAAIVRARTIEELRQVSEVVYNDKSTELAYMRQGAAEFIKLRRKIDAYEVQVTALRVNASKANSANRQLADKVDALERIIAVSKIDFTERLAQRDAQFAREREVILTAAEHLLETPEGLRALQLYNAGGKDNYNAAKVVLAEITKQRETNRLVEATEDLRSNAVIILGGRNRGDDTTANTIAAWQAVTNTSFSKFQDWIEISRLYREANQLAEARTAALRAFESATNDVERAAALVEQGDALVLMAEDEAALGKFDNAVGKMANMFLVVDKLGAMKTAADMKAAGDLMYGIVQDFSELIVLFKAPAQIDDAIATYGKALALTDTAGTNAQADLRLTYRSIIKLKLGDLRVLKHRSGQVDTFQRLLLEAGKRMQARVDEAIETGAWNAAAADADNREMLRKMASVISDVGEIEQARAAYGEALTTHRDLERRHPRTLLYLRGQADSLDKIASTYKDESKLPEAITSSRAALAIRRDVVATDGATAIHRQELSTTLMTLGAALDSFKNEAAAQTVLLESYKIRCELAEQDPTSAEYQRLIATVLEALASAHAPGFTWARALAQYETMKAHKLFAPLDEVGLRRVRLNATGPFASPPAAAANQPSAVPDTSR